MEHSRGEDWFVAMYHATGPRVLAYIRRHSTSSDWDDVIAEVYAVAWRRRAVPPNEPLPWLLVAARRVPANRRRTAFRADRLWRAAVENLWDRTPGHDDDVVQREAVMAALEQCSRLEREALLLVYWDGLSADQAARVCGCSRHAFNVRLTKARKRVRPLLREIDGDEHLSTIDSRTEART